MWGEGVDLVRRRNIPGRQTELEGPMPANCSAPPTQDPLDTLAPRCAAGAMADELKFLLRTVIRLEACAWAGSVHICIDTDVTRRRLFSGRRVWQQD